MNNHIQSYIGLIAQKYINVFLTSYIDVFLTYKQPVCNIYVSCLKRFASPDESSIKYLLEELKRRNIILSLIDERDEFESISVSYSLGDKKGNFQYLIDDLPMLIDLSSKSQVHLLGIVLMRIVSRIICKHKIMYKAVVLDLDDTLWNGTLEEDGIQAIERNLRTKEGAHYIRFMRFIKTIANELGIYVALCSKNSEKSVTNAINSLSQDIFPLKGSIDCVVANYKDKSLNIKEISNNLSILPNSIVFIDDNPIIRDEVREKLPMVFTPEWKSIDELMTMLIMSCIFDRFEMSMKAKNRKRQMKILRTEKEQTMLPKLYIEAHEDIDHIEASNLYSKSNQFNFVSEQIDYNNAKSFYFNLFRANGENLGVCSAITLVEQKGVCFIINWAISCRYFGIGLEEFIVIYLAEKYGDKIHSIYCVLQLNEKNQKVKEFIDKYKQKIFNSIDLCSEKNKLDTFTHGDENINNLVRKLCEKKSTILNLNPDTNLLKCNTNLRIK